MSNTKIMKIIRNCVGTTTICLKQPIGFVLVHLKEFYVGVRVVARLCEKVDELDVLFQEFYPICLVAWRYC